MHDFIVGDIVRIKSQKPHSDLRLVHWEPLIFTIVEIKDDKVLLDFHSDFIPIADVEAIPANGIEDIVIYYDPVIMASILLPGMQVPVHKTDYTYYLEAFKKCYYQHHGQNINIYELVMAQNLKYVHEIQHYLNDEISEESRKGLKIHHRIHT